MTTRRQARVLVRAASATFSTYPALKRIPRLHAAAFFLALLAPLLTVWALGRAGILAPPLAHILPLAAVSLAAFLALPVGGIAQALAAAAARQAWERRPGGLTAAWQAVRPHLGALVWRGIGPGGLFGGRDVAAWIHADLGIEPRTLPRHRLFGRGWALVVVLGALFLGLPVAFLLMTVLAQEGPAAELAMSFLLGIGASFALVLYGTGVLGMLGAVAAAAEHHEAAYHRAAPGFPAMLRAGARGRARPPVRFARA